VTLASGSPSETYYAFPERRCSRSELFGARSHLIVLPRELEHRPGRLHRVSITYTYTPTFAGLPWLRPDVDRVIRWEAELTMKRALRIFACEMVLPRWSSASF